MKKLLTTLLLSALILPLASAQNLLIASYEGSFHLVEKVTEENFIILMNGEEVELPIASSSVSLREMPEFLPGYVKIENETMVETNEDDANRTYGDLVYFRYAADITPNRNLKDPFMVLRWIHSDNTAFIAAVPLKDFKAGEEQRVSHKLWVHERFKLIDPSVHYMGMGFEIGSSKNIEEPLTPYAFALGNADGNRLPDGNIKPIRMLPTPSVKDDAGNPITGSVHMIMKVDELGYVSSIEVQKYDNWKLAKATLMEAPLFLFQPKVVDGEPVPTGIVLPFRFK